MQQKSLTTLSHFRVVAVSNERQDAFKFFSMGMELGHPDLYFTWIKNNTTYIYYLEIKTKKGKLNTNQKKWWKNFQATQNCNGNIGYGLELCQNLVLDNIK